MTIDRFDSNAPAYDAIEREKKLLRDQLIKSEARCNGLVAELTQSRLLHEQDCADISSKHFENKRLGNRCTILEAKNAELDARVKLQSGRIEELESLLVAAGAERR